MVLLEAVQRNDRSFETVAVVVANGLPLAGVVAFGWELDALVSLYWFELGVLSFWALVRALFAGRPSELDENPLIVGALAGKRTSVPIPVADLEIRLSTLPVLGVAAPLLALVWFFAGVMTVGVLGETPDPDALVMVTLAVFGIFVSEGASTLVEYFYRGGYREQSAQTAIQGVFTRGAVIGLGGMFTAMIVGLTAGSVSPDESIGAVDPAVVGLPILVGIVLVKFGFDLAGLYRERLVAFDEASYFELGWAYEPPSDDPVEPIEAVNDRVRPTVAGRSLGGVSPRNVRRHAGALAVGGFVLLVALLFAMGRVWDVVFALVAVSLLVPMGLLTADYWLRYGGTEYRIAEDGSAIVAYDRLFRTRLWRIEPWDESGLHLERDLVDSWLDTSTVVVERPGEISDLRLPRLRDPDSVLDVFDRRATRP